MLLGEKKVDPLVILKLLAELTELLRKENNDHIINNECIAYYERQIKNDTIQYNFISYFEQGIQLENEAVLYQNKAQIQTNNHFFRLFFYYQAQEKYKFAQIIFKNSLKYNNNAKAMYHLKKISNQLEDIKKTISSLISPEMIKEEAVVYKKANKINRIFHQLCNQNLLLQEAEKNEKYSKKISKEQRSILLAEIKQIMDQAQKELNDYEILPEERRNQQFYRQQQLELEIEEAKKLFVDKKFNLIEKKIHEIKMNELKKEYLERLDKIENKHLKVARSFIALFNENPQREYIQKAEEIMAQAAEIGSEKNIYNPYLTTIKAEVYYIWEGIKEASKILENPEILW